MSYVTLQSKKIGTISSLDAHSRLGGCPSCRSTGMRIQRFTAKFQWQESCSRTIVLHGNLHPSHMGNMKKCAMLLSSMLCVQASISGL